MLKPWAYVPVCHTLTKPPASLYNSLTIEAWVYLPLGYPLTKLPIICNMDGSLCMYIENGVLNGRFGAHVTTGSTVIPAWSWTQVVMRYNAEGKALNKSSCEIQC